MTQKIVVGLEKTQDPLQYCEALENGNILFFPAIPFDFYPEDIDFLLRQKQGGSKSRKNIAYKPSEDQISNHNTEAPEQTERLRRVLRNYSQSVTGFLTNLLSPYSEGWKLDYASFRPFQEKGRKLRVRARNDLLHVDVFPTRPLHGSRILRFFTNINPKESRHWITSEGFETLAEKYAGEVSIPPSTKYDWKSRIGRKMKQWLSMAGLKVTCRSPYDHFMLQMHHFMKENQTFQNTCHKDHWDFPPGSCWVVFTDAVSHAALAGQYALEQTFIVPQSLLLCPEKSPVCILQRLSGRNLVNTEYLRDILK